MEKAFLKAIGEHQGIIHKVSRMYRDSLEDQEDLFQEIVFQLWKSFPGFRNESKVSTWMYRIALNTALAKFRKNSPALDFRENLPEVKVSEEDGEKSISEQEELMFRALRCLNDPEKALISLFLEDYSYKEIGEIIGISENYVGVRINRIKKKLKTLLK